MKTILRNLISIFRRFKTAMLLNVLGLSIAFAAFIAISIQIRYERNFDRCYETSERLYRVNLQRTGVFATIFPRALVEAIIQSSPHIVAGTLLTPNFGGSGSFLSVDRNGERSGFKKYVSTCHASLPEMFAFEMVEGERDCLKDPEKIIIPQSLAQTLFGNDLALGQTIYAEEAIWAKSGKAFTVGGVYRDLPENTQLNNVIYTQMDAEYARDNFDMSNWPCYLLLDSPESARIVADNFNASFDFNKISDPTQKIELLPIADIYYEDGEADALIFKGGNREKSYLLLIIAILIIGVAAINYTNFSTALTPMRIKSINTQKVLGSSDRVLRRSLQVEAILISLLSWSIGLFIVFLFDRIQVLPFLNAPVNLIQNQSVVALSFCIAIATGWFAGLYPSYYVTSFPPALALKGSFGLSASGRKLRTVLIGIQFIVSIALIICAFFIQLQNRYMHNFSLGFEKDEVATVEISASLYNQNKEALVNRLKEYAGITDVAFAMDRVASKDSYSTSSAKINDDRFSYFAFIVSPNFLEVMGIPVIEGRSFNKSDGLSSDPVYIFNKFAKNKANMEIGTFTDAYNPGPLVGFTDDLKFSSVRKSDDVIAFMTGDFNVPMKHVYVRIAAGTNPYEVVDHIRKSIASLDPLYPAEVSFYDTIIDQLYQKELNLKNLVMLFSMLAILLSLIGVFGLVIFDTQYKRKEIALRKIHGATVSEILLMFNKAYLKIVLVCFVLGAPLAWYVIVRWQEGFAYKTPVYWWVFALAFLIVAGITLLIVNFQNWKAANANPINGIKSE